MSVYYLLWFLPVEGKFLLGAKFNVFMSQLNIGVISKYHCSKLKVVYEMLDSTYLFFKKDILVI